MTEIFNFIDLPVSWAVAIALAVAVFGLAAAVAYVAFRFFMKSVRMAVRFALVAGVIIMLLTAGITLWWFAGSDPSPKASTKPTATKKK